VLAELSRELEDLVGRTALSVVAVEQRQGQGSGIVFASDGYVLTNSHVVRGPRSQVRVRLANGEDLRGEVVGDDPSSDLAVVHVSSHGLPALPLVESRRLRVGQLVVAIGNPLRFERSVTLGVVSALDRTLPAPGGRSLEGLVQTDAAINPGNSGGPLLDANGAVVGINTAMIPYARGIGFAIPAHAASWIVAVLLQKGRIDRPFLGIAASGVDLLPVHVHEAGQARAVRVHEVSAGSPAEAAGVTRGDLLLSANGTPLASVDDLQRVLVLAAPPQVQIEALRAGRRHALEATPRREPKAA